MANNQYINKVVYGDQTLIDLSNDTITADILVSGYTAHNATGASITGTLPSKTGLDITQEFIERAYQSTDHILGLNIPYGYYSSGTLKLSKIQIPVPESGTNTIEICVPNGTTEPDPSDDDDWIPITFVVDSNGNSNITDDAISANGVSF